MSQPQKLTEKNISEVLQILDQVFGALSMIYLGFLCTAYYFGHLDSINGLVLFFLYIAINLTISQLTIRSKKVDQVIKYEVCRYLLFLFIICPLLLVWIKGQLAPFWYAHFIMTTAGSNTAFQISGKPFWAFVNSIFTALSYLITTYFFLDNVNWYLAFAHAATMTMFSFLFIKMLDLAYKALNREVAKSKELKMALEELSKAQALAIEQSKMSAIGEMAGGVAHEINNPLGVITLNIELLKKIHKKGQLTDEKLLQTLDTIQGTMTRITKIISALKNVSREAESVDLEFFSLQDLFSDIQGLCFERFKGHGVDLKITIPDAESTLKLYCNRIQISQVFLNLLSNSFDAIKNSQEKWIHIEVSKQSTNYIIKVIDSGQGLTQEAKDKLFQPFFSTKSIGSGTGLGLSISKSIIEKYNGTLVLDTNSINTCFKITIPIEQSTHKEIA